MAFLGTYYFRNKKTAEKKALFCKALATLIPGGMLIVHILGSETEVSAPVPGLVFTLTAVLCYAVADVLLEIKFVLGAVCFSIGHLSLLAAFIFSGECFFRLTVKGRYELLPESVAVYTAFYIAMVILAFLLLGKYFCHLKAKGLLGPLIAYILILSAMCAAGVTAGIRGFMSGTAGFQALFPLLGGCCFAASDVMLGRNRLGKRRNVTCSALVLILYYAAVYCFVMRLWNLLELRG